MAIIGGDGSIILKTAVDTAGLAKGLKNINGIAKTTAKGILLIGGAISAVTGLAVSAYAEFEQLAGGAELMFGAAVDTVMKNAKEAYATVQMSQNEYLRQVNGFATGLKVSLNGNEKAAADLAHRIIVAEADIVAATGETQEAIQNAFNGVMKSNFMMLDNLKLGITPTKEGFQEVIDKVNSWNKANGKATKYQMGNLADMQSALVDYVEMQGMAGYASREAAETIQGSSAMFKASWQNLLIAMSSGEGLDDAINGFIYSLEKVVQNISPVIERTIYGLGQAVQRALPMLVQTVVAALTQQIPYLVVAVYNMIVGLFKGLVLGIKALFTGGTAKATETIKSNVESGSKGAGAMAKNMKKTAEETKKAGKEAKKTTAAFDDLQILSSGAGGSSGSGVETPEQSIDAGVSGGVGSIAPQDFSGPITAELATIMAIAGGALLAIGILLLFLGNPFYGIGFIIAGAVTVGVAMAQGEKLNLEEITNGLTTVMAIAGGALLALGIILLWLGGVVSKGIAIGMIVAGAALIVSAVAAKAAFAPDDVKGWLTLIMGIAAGALLALGIILCMVGSTPIGVGMIIAGSVALVSAVALNFNEVTDKITGWVALIMGIAGAALLVLGIILCCSGGAIALGISLIAVGAVSLVTTVALNWSYIVDQMQGTFGLIMGLVSAGILILGIILCCCGIITPLTIGMIIAGAAGLVTVVAFNWNFIVDKVKEIWDKIKQFWKTYIAPIFTAKWWADLGKKALNGLIGIVEKGLNFLIEKINDFIGGISKITSAVGDLVGADWKLPKIPKVSIPRLARGAVIPPNREFLAVLGDQKHGTNIEAPAELIKQMAMEAMLEVGAVGQTTKEEHYYLNETELMSIVYKLVKGGERLKGNSLVSGGAY